MSSWESHIQQEEIINIGKCLDARQESCDEFCSLVINEGRRMQRFYNARKDA